MGLTKFALFSLAELRRKVLSSQQSLIFLFNAVLNDPTLESFCCNDPVLQDKWQMILTDPTQLQIALDMKGDIPHQGPVLGIKPFHQLLGLYYYKLSLLTTSTCKTDPLYQIYRQHLVKAAQYHYIPALLILERLCLAEIKHTDWLIASKTGHMVSLKSMEEIFNLDFLKLLFQFTEQHGSAVYLIIADFYYNLAYIASLYHGDASQQIAIDELLRFSLQFLIVAEKLAPHFSMTLQNAGGVCGLNTYGFNSFEALRNLLLHNEQDRLRFVLDQSYRDANRFLVENHPHLQNSSTSCTA